jgi:hypothetical protein
MCEGTRIFQRCGHHNPNNVFEWKSCPYCDHHGLQIIEASQSTIVLYFDQLDEDTKKELLKKIAPKSFDI